MKLGSANLISAQAQRHSLIAVAGVCLLTSSLTVLGQDASNADKSGYNLLERTPDHLRREMSTDRPDKTESPYTVDAGHYQVEMDLVNYAYDRHNPDHTATRVDSFSLAPINFKVGLLNNVDVQFVVETYNHVREKDLSTGTVIKRRGFGDVTTRVKWNLWGNDNGDTALALMPWIKLPTNQDGLGNDAVEGGLIVPLAVSLPAGWGMGLMTEVDFLERSTGSGYEAEFINSITFAHDIIGDLGGYVEFFSAVNTESSADWVGTVDLGLTYAVNENVQLDGGVNLGVTRAADDINPFIGVSWRF